MKRDGFACRDCGADDKTLNIHHCHYARGEPWKTNTRLLLTLCEDCHDSRGVLESDAKLALGLIVSEMANSEDNEQLRDFVANLVHTSERMVENPPYYPTIVDGAVNRECIINT